MLISQEFSFFLLSASELKHDSEEKVCQATKTRINNNSGKTKTQHENSNCYSSDFQTNQQKDVGKKCMKKENFLQLN